MCFACFCFAAVLQSVDIGGAKAYNVSDGKVCLRGCLRRGGRNLKRR